MRQIRQYPMVTADGKAIEIGQMYWMDAGRDDIRQVKCVSIDNRRRKWIGQSSTGVETTWRFDASTRWHRPWASQRAILAHIRKELLDRVKSADKCVQRERQNVAKARAKVKAFDAWVRKGCPEVKV